MCSMCHYCGTELAKSMEDQGKQENGNAVNLSSGRPILSCKCCWDKQVRESVKRDGISPYGTPIISPTTSLSSSDRSFSSCSEFSVDINSCDRGQEECVTGNSPEGLLNSVDRSNTRKRNSMMDSMNDNDMNAMRDAEIMQTSNVPEAKDNVVGNTSRSSDGETGASESIDGEMDINIWDPPEPEDPDDDQESTVSYDDDEDEFGDGTKWGKPSSLSHIKEERLGSYRFKEEKQRAMEEVINGKFKAIVSQLLKSVGVSGSLNDGESWVNIVASLSWEAALYLKPDAIEGKEMGPNGYVKVKCIATGSRNQSQLIKGLVFKKHAAHKHMPTKYKNPRLLLIQGVLGQSSSGLSSFNSIVQEKDHLKRLIEMIDTWHPNVIFVEKTVSRDVQESILAKGITLVFDMKLHRLKRVARCTGLPIISSETLMNQKLKQSEFFKQCDSFHIEKFIEEHSGIGEGGRRLSKTLMFLEGCPTRLGCTILLKGSHSDELKRIKCVVQCAVVMAYHLILETSFLVDQRAMFSTIPFVGAADVLATDQQYHSSTAGNLSMPPLDESAIDTGSSTIDIPISSGFLEKSSFQNRETKGDEVGNRELDGSSVLSLEPYNPAIFSGFSSLSASLKKVIGNHFPLAPSAPYQSLSTYFGLSGSEKNGEVTEVKTSEVSDHIDVEIKGNSDEEKLIDDGKPHSPSASSEAMLNLKIDGDDNENKLQNKEDINTVLDSQSILVLMSSRNALRGTICEQSHFSHIMFYRNFDVPLGKFLQDNLLNQRTKCVTCGELPEAHFYYYAHHNKQLTIQVKRLPNEKRLPGEAEGKLWMWSRCGKCKSGNGISNSTKSVLISTAARHLSFGKFLELSFSDYSSSSMLSSCGHSPRKDFLYFFGLGHMVAMFRYSSVATYNVSVPPQKLEFSNSIRLDKLKEEFEDVYMKGMLLFREVESTLGKIKSKFVGSILNLQGSLKEFSAIEEMLKLEISEFEENIHNVVAKSSNSNQGPNKFLNLNRVRWELLIESCIWDRRLHSLLLPDPTVVVAGTTKKSMQQQLEVDGITGGRNVGTETNPGNGYQVSDVMGDMKVKVGKSVEGSVQESEGCGDQCKLASSVIKDIEKPLKDCVSPKELSKHESLEASSVCGHHFPVVYGQAETELADDLQEDKTIPISAELDRNYSVDSDGILNGGSPHSLLASLENSNGWFWMPFSEIKQIYMKDLKRGYVPKFDCMSSYSPEHIPAGYQLISEERSRLHIPLGSDNYIVSDYDGELSSIIACALALLEDLPALREASDEDKRRGKTFESLNSLIRVPTITSSRWSFGGSSDSDSLHSTHIISLEEYSRLSSFDGLNLLDSLAPSDACLNSEVALGVGKSLGKGKYSVICLYANQFRDLRKQCCPSEVDYIASLSRCKNWDAKGGKSKSFFAKTLDDRFIIKEIKKTEYESFEKFAPDYFKYMDVSFESKNQTCLAKILGIYQVIIRQTKTGKELRHHDLMVMENLTFSRNITRQYDLKGALHARFNSAADGSGDVLLDQNFVNDMNASPLYVSNNAKRLLTRAVWNDTTFLNSINVMDYSLLVGVDAQQRELVCGIIDYLRQYTWDKQLETWVKSSLVVPRNLLPTVISPKEYKKRFRKFMSTHFLSVPDHWCMQGSIDPCQLCGTKGDDSPQSKSLKQGHVDGFCSG